jgi:hypothetical protein
VTRRGSCLGGSALAATLLVVAVSRPAAAEGSTARPPEASVSRPSSPWLTRIQTGGLVLFGVSYGAALGVPVVAGFSDGREWFAVPLAGPLIGMTHELHLDPWAIVLDEIGQVGGVTLFLAGDSVSWGSSASVARCRGGGLCVGAGGVF